jgi:hypothetical protein
MEGRSVVDIVAEPTRRIDLLHDRRTKRSKRLRRLRHVSSDRLEERREGRMPVFDDDAGGQRLHGTQSMLVLTEQRGLRSMADGWMHAGLSIAL